MWMASNLDKRTLWKSSSSECSIGEVLLLSPCLQKQSATRCISPSVLRAWKLISKPNVTVQQYTIFIEFVLMTLSWHAISKQQFSMQRIAGHIFSRMLIRVHSCHWLAPLHKQHGKSWRQKWSKFDHWIWSSSLLSHLFNPDFSSKTGTARPPKEGDTSEKIFEILMDFGPFYSCTYCLEATKELNLLDVRL